MDIQEKNRIIARYMGYDLITPEMRKNPKNWVNSFWEKKDGDKNVVLGRDTYLRYHTDWNWLMKVVEKISKTETPSSTEEQRDYHYPVTFAMISPENQFMVRFSQFFLHQSDSLIEATFEAVVETIQFLTNLK